MKKRTHVVAALLLTSATLAGIAPPAAFAAPVPVAGYRQLIGEVSGPTYLEASVPAEGRYALEFDVTGVAMFDAYVNGVETGYVGGPDGVYQTKSLQLTAGGQLVEVVGPEGTGSATVYVVQTS